MISSLAQGIAAGLAIAVPVGAIGILIIETGIRRGFRVAWAAGAGTASADGIYATIAAGFGAALAGVIAPWERPLRIAAIVVLVVLAVRGLLAVRRAWLDAVTPRGSEAVEVDAGRAPGDRDGGGALAGPGDVTRPGPPGLASDLAVAGARGGDSAPGAVLDRAAPGALRTYLTFLGLTLMNPQTVVYFAALILALGPTGSGPAEKAAFVLGACSASLAWQTLIAAAGAILHSRLSPSLRIGVSLLGNVIILLFAVAIGRQLLA